MGTFAKLDQAGAAPKAGGTYARLDAAGKAKVFQPVEDYTASVGAAFKAADDEGRKLWDRSLERRPAPANPVEFVKEGVGDQLQMLKTIGAMVNAPLSLVTAIPDALIAAPAGRAISRGTEAIGLPSYEPSRLAVDKSGVRIAAPRRMTPQESEDAMRGSINAAMTAAMPARGAPGSWQFLKGAQGPRDIASLVPAPRLPKTAPTEPEIAAKVLMKRAKADPDEMQKLAEALRASGIQPTALDVTGQKGMRLTRAVGVTNDDMGEALVAHAEKTMAGTKPAVMSKTRGLASADGGMTATELADQLATARDAAARTQYAKPYDTFVDVPDAVKDMLGDSAGRSLIAKARSDAIWNQDWGRQVELDKLLAVTKDGQLPRISAGTLDRLRMSARDAGRQFSANNMGTRAKGAFQRQEQLDNILDGIPELKEARADYHAKSRAIDVISKPGVQLDPFSTDPTDYAAWLKTLPPEAIAANRVKLRQDILDTLGGQRSNTFGSIDEIATSAYARDNLTQAFGPKEAGEYLSNITARLKQARGASMASPNGGSRTAVLENDTGKALQGVADAMGALRDVGTGNLPGLATKIAARLKTMGVNEKEAAALVGAVTDPSQLDAVIAAAAKARAGPGPSSLQRVRQLAIPVSGASTSGLPKKRK